ncbi:MAG TPA: MBL fold metallo-hydrolase [Stellaceae bacterium]|nr:MBL fold metallo-hydrolase [Stellaceae bacterium]
METRIDEIADGIYRLSTLVPEINPPAGFSFNQFLIRAEEPLLFHLGHRRMFPQISAAVAKLVPLSSLRWLACSHLEADECGAMNEWLAAAAHAAIAHCPLGANVSLRDMADRPPRVVGDNETVDLGSKRMRFLATPHLPHGWDAQLLFEETTQTLFCSDLFAHSGDGPALVESDIVAPAIAGETQSRSISVSPTTAPSLRRLAALRPKRLALMHGSSYAGDAAGALGALADHFAAELRAAGEQ